MLDWFRRRRTIRTLDALITAHADAGTFQGAVLLARRGRTLVRRASGPGLTTDASFRIGSIAKTFTALAVLRLTEAGALSTDDVLARFVSEVPGADRLRIHHLLSNTSGIPDYLVLPELQPRIAEPHRLEDLVGYVSRLPRLFAPGERLSYSNSNWVLLALVIERAGRSSFPAELRRLVFDPLGLTGTFVDLDSGRSDLLPGWSIGDDGLVPARPIHPSVELGAGGIRSTVDDLWRLDRAVANPGFLRAETLLRMTTPVASDGPLGYGYGLFSTARFGRPVVGHTGGTFGFTAFWSRYPREDATTIVLANLDNGSAERLERDLGAALLGEPYELPGLRRFVSVPPDQLTGYVGRYRSGFAGRRIDFAVIEEAGELYADFPLLPRARLRPLSSSRFFTRLKGGEVVFEFVRDHPDGPARKIAVDWSGMQMECPRLE